MAMRYRIVLSATFDNAIDRNTWYDKIKAAWNNAKPTSPAILSASLQKEEHYESEQTTENIG